MQRLNNLLGDDRLDQLFCDGPATQINTMLLGEMRQAGVTLVLHTEVESVSKVDSGFAVQLSTSSITAESLIVATGGKSIPKMGATGLGYQLASQFGMQLTETRPGLVPLTFETGALEKLEELLGIAADAIVRHGNTAFEEALMFTHRGLSGPAILQISSHWLEGEAIAIDLLPHQDASEKLHAARQAAPKLQVQTVLGGFLPRKLAQLLGDELDMAGMIGDFSDKKLAVIDARLKAWTLKPVGSEGYRTAEVTLGGLDTRDLDARTIAAQDVSSLYFVGEVVDVTG